jgi:IclR family acetate operon transcriptional repressor
MSVLGSFFSLTKKCGFVYIEKPGILVLRSGTTMATSKTVNSITRGADILRSLSEGIDRVSDLSNRLHLRKSTVHRFLKSLQMSGLVMQDPLTRRYFLGPLILNIASRPIISHQPLLICAFEEMRSLRDLSRETVVLHIRMGLERMCLEELPSFENIRYTAGKGFVAPIYTGSAGKVLLSDLEDSELQILMNNLRLDPISPNTITDTKALLKEVEKVRRRGYATSFGERILGSASISVSVKHYICPVALSVLGPDNRFNLRGMMDILESIKEGSRRISQKLMEVNPSTPRPSGRGLPSTRSRAEGLRVDPERRLFTPPIKAGLGAAARVNQKGKTK